MVISWSCDWLHKTRDTRKRPEEASSTRLLAVGLPLRHSIQLRFRDTLYLDAASWDCLTLQRFELTVFSLLPWGPSGARSTNHKQAVSTQVIHMDMPLCACHGERCDNSNTVASGPACPD